MSIMIKIVRVPGTVTEVGLEDGATVQDALDTADTYVAENEAITVNGVPATPSTPLTDQARVVISRGAKSAMWFIFT
jgi:UPF0288 family protein (methanogenesis marker protein 3)